MICPGACPELRHVWRQLILVAAMLPVLHPYMPPHARATEEGQSPCADWSTTSIHANYPTMPGPKPVSQEGQTPWTLVWSDGSGVRWDWLALLDLMRGDCPEFPEFS